MHFKKLLKTKKKFKAFKERYPDYEGNHNHEDVREYIKEKFVSVAKSHNVKENVLFSIFTCAIDTDKMEGAWKAVKEWVFNKRLKVGGFDLGGGDDSSSK